MSISEINKHFCIFGVGAIGGLITANLKKNGYNVSCIAQGSTYEKISSEQTENGKKNKTYIKK